MGSVLVALLLVLVMLPGIARAEGPLACDPREEATICELKVERNNAMDELAIAGGKLRVTLAREVAAVKWWAEYADGVTAQTEWWQRYAEGMRGQRCVDDKHRH